MPDPVVVYIYALRDPCTDEIRYIGKAENIDRRIREHVKRAPAARAHSAAWIRKLCERGLMPVVEILETTDQEHWAEVERAWIQNGRDKGWPLTNHADGGQGGGGHRGFKHSAETKERLRIVNIGRKQTAESIEKTAAAKRGKPLTAECRANISRALTGKKISAEAVERNRLAHLGKKQSAELVEKRIAPLRGRSRPYEAMEKMAKTRQCLSKDQVAEMTALYKSGHTQRQLATMFGIGQSSVWRILNHKNVYTYKDVVDASAQR
jgi:group I intron endonuclease